MTVTTQPESTWAYREVTTLLVAGRTEPYLHVDSSTLVRVAPPTPNPLAIAAGLGSTVGT